MGAAVAAPPTPFVELLSPYSGMRLCLAPPELALGPGGTVREVPGTRRMVKFRNGRAQMPRHWMPLLEQHASFTGMGTRKVVFLIDDDDAPLATRHGVEVVTGARSTNTGAAVPPLPEWNQMSVQAVLDAIKAGRVTDVLGALNFESAHRRRARIIADLAKRVAAMASAKPEVEEPEEAPVAAAAVERVPSGEQVE